MSTSILPNRKVSDNVLDVYNSVLSMHYLIENPLIVNVIENDSLD